MNHKDIKIILLIVNIVLTIHVFAQQNEQEKLETKRKELKEEIKKIKYYIDNTQQKESSLSTQVQDLNHKINTRQKLIRVMDQEVNKISRDLMKKNREIMQFNNELNVLKKDYADMIFKSYKNRKADNQLLFLFSSQSFYQGYLRFQYLKQYTQYRKKQADEIQKKSEILKTLVDSLNVKKKAKETLAEDQKNEQLQMEEEKAKQLVLVKKYQKQKKEYQAQIRKKQEEEKLLTNQIEGLIIAAIKTSSTSSKKDNTKTTSNKNEFVLAPKDLALAGQFSANKGNLPWPVEKGLVTVRFGKQPDLMDPKLMIESSGVRIATAENQKARSIFDGKVLAVQKNPQNGILSVLIQHGNYITVYANLRSVSVSKGNEVKIKQNIGTIYTDKTTGKTILKFQIWQNDQKLDPSLWINGM